MYASDRGVISLYRSVSDKLARWHGDPMRKALLVTGARQVGKTFAIREFIRSTYESSLEINFVETPQAKAIFEGNLDAATIIANLTVCPGKVQCAGAITYPPWYLLMFFSSKADELQLVSW